MSDGHETWTLLLHSETWHTQKKLARENVRCQRPARERDESKRVNEKLEKEQRIDRKGRRRKKKKRRLKRCEAVAEEEEELIMNDVHSKVEIFVYKLCPDDSV